MNKSVSRAMGIMGLVAFASCTSEVSYHTNLQEQDLSEFASEFGVTDAQLRAAMDELLQPDGVMVLNGQVVTPETRKGHGCVADATEDGLVNSDDLTALKSQYGKTCEELFLASSEEVHCLNFVRDPESLVNISDLVVFADLYFQGAEISVSFCEDATVLDNDGLGSYLEARHDLDPNNPDTDGDGVSDYDELFPPGSSECGNSIVDLGEDCDGSIDGETCSSLGLVSGLLSCTSSCTFDSSDCEGFPSTGNVAYIQNHPNLWYNSDEIAELRKMVLVDKSPSYLVTAFNQIRGRMATAKPESYSAEWTDHNMGAAFSYMIEPTQAKLSAIKASLLSWWVPRSGLTTDVMVAKRAHYPLAFFYDLTYEEDVWTDEERTKMDTWFAYTPKKYAKRNWNEFIDNYWDLIDEEGTARRQYSNWIAFSASGSSLFALVSHDQSAVDAMFDGKWDPNHFEIPEMDYVGDPQLNPRNLHNYVVGEVYPSGFAWDGYKRGGYGYDPATEVYTGTQGGGEAYGLYVLIPLLLGAEAAAHNGLDLFEVNNHGLLRAHVTARPWADHAWRHADHREEAYINFSSNYWWLHRKYPDHSDVNSILAENNYPLASSSIFSQAVFFGFPTR